MDTPADSSTFDAAGAVDAPAVVLVHGSVVSRKMWIPQLQGLSDSYRVIAPDLPGHGALAQTDFTFDAAVLVLSEIIKQQACGRAVVAGLSLGGYVAIDLAHRRPDLVSGLVLSGCSRSFTGGLGLYLKAVSALMQRGWLTQSRATAEAKTRRLVPPELAHVADAQIAAGVYPEPLGAAFGEMAGRDFAALLRSFGGPVLILNGEKDSFARKGEKAFSRACRHAEIKILPGAGHACNLDQPAAFNGALHDFLTRVQLGADSSPGDR